MHSSVIMHNFSEILPSSVVGELGAGVALHLLAVSLRRSSCAPLPSVAMASAVRAASSLLTGKSPCMACVGCSSYVGSLKSAEG